MYDSLPADSGPWPETMAKLIALFSILIYNYANFDKFRMINKV